MTAEQRRAARASMQRRSRHRRRGPQPETPTRRSRRGSGAVPGSVLLDDLDAVARRRRARLGDAPTTLSSVPDSLMIQIGCLLDASSLARLGRCARRFGVDRLGDRAGPDAGRLVWDGRAMRVLLPSIAETCARLAVAQRPRVFRRKVAEDRPGFLAALRKIEACAASPTVVLQPTSPGRPAIFVTAGAEVTVGRSPTCDVQFSETFISRQHAVLHRLPRGLQLLPICRNRRLIRVNRRSTQQHVPYMLRFGDEVNFAGAEGDFAYVVAAPLASSPYASPRGDSYEGPPTQTD